MAAGDAGDGPDVAANVAENLSMAMLTVLEPLGPTERADTAVSLAIESGRIIRLHAVRNPHKLARLDGVAALTVPDR